MAIFSRQTVRSAACALLLLLPGAAPVRAADAPAPAVIILDASGSMAARLPDHRSKLDAARAIVSEAVGAWPAGGQIGVIAYGHRRKNDCADIQTLLPVGPLSRDAVTKALKPLKALGMTPLSQSLQSAAQLLPAGGGTIVLVSDGIETCQADPCAVAAALKAANASLIIDVVGFGLKRAEVSQLACIANHGGGKFFDAKDAAGLTQALATVRAAAAAPPAPPPESEPKPIVAPAPEPVEAPKPPPTPAPTPAPQSPKIVRTHLVAVAGALGAIVDAPVHWTLQDAHGANVYDGDSRALGLDLAPGRYAVTAAAANAKGTTKIDVTAAQEQSFNVTVDAGRLDLSLAASPDVPPYSDAEAQGLAWTLEPLAGQPGASLPQIARPSLLLASGRYHVHAALKSLQADGTVDIKPGAITALVLTFRLGTLDLEAVLDGATQPLDDAALMRWRIGTGADAQAVEGQSRPRLTLPEGTYPVVLTISGADLTASAAVKAGQENLVKVMVPGGKLNLSARLGPQSPPLDNWHDTFWTITPVGTLGPAPAPIEVQAPAPSLPLVAGRWHVELTSGAATVGQDVPVVPGAPTVVVLDVEAGRLSIQATPASGAAASNVVYAARAIDATGTTSSKPAFETGAGSSASTILPAGRWRVTADDSNGRHAEAQIELEAGEEQALSLTLQ